jgi:putative multiple sugar transport system substrate-binding protein
MKKFLTVAMAAGALVVAACGGGTATTAPASAGTQSTAPSASTSASTGTESMAPSGSAAAGGTGLVGIAMPTKSSARWIADGDNLVKALTGMGYTTDLQYAEDDIPTQVSQVENMITKGSKALVIAAIDGTTLTDTLQKAADAGIKVFSYDRLIRNSPNVDYYAAFDNYKVGVAQAQSIIDSLQLDTAAGPFNIELFAGSPDDNNAGFFFNGAMDTLKPYLDSGKLVVQSGETKFPEQVGTLRWSGDAAQARMDNILASKYADKKVDAVLSPYDGISRGVIASLKQVGYYSADKPGPVVTGQDAELPSVKSILSGEQTSTVFKDTRLLAAQVAKMVNQLLSGQTVEVNDTTTYENGVKTVPSYLLPVVSVNKDNVTQALVDTGYYTADEVKP